MIFARLGRPDLDLFASGDNCKLQTFVSPERDQTTFASDAMSLDWREMYTYAFPSTPLLLPVLQKIQPSNCMFLLVAPYWPRMTWFTILPKLALEAPMPLSQSPDLLSQRLGNGRLVLHSNPQVSETTCLESVQSKLVKQGFSEDVTAQMSRARRQSTRNLYTT
jgi:hypothetical protein